MTKRFKAGVAVLLGFIAALCLLLGVLFIPNETAHADEDPQTVAHQTVAVHDPSIVLAYEVGNRTYPTAEAASAAGGSPKKVYYVFGTNLATAKSYDLVNWENVTLNLHNFNQLYTTLGNVATYSGLTKETLEGNLWAPDVIWNPTMKKWTMYLSVNGATYNSSIVLLTADSLAGTWTYVGPVVYSGMGFGSNKTELTDYKKVTGEDTVPERYIVNTKGGKGTGTLLYGLNAIDACIFLDGERLYMTYGSWFGGIYMLELDPATGLRKSDDLYTDQIAFSDGSAVSSSAKYTVYTDKYLGIHIAGGHGTTGEGSYIEKIGDYYYLFMSYGGYAPKDGYNMRVFRSETVTGFTGDDVSQANFVGYKDASGATAMVLDSDLSNRGDIGSVGGRLMTGYSWSWWDFAYIAQGHNSAFVDDDGKIYVVYHNKYTDGTDFHVLKVHELLVNKDGWLVVSPFESDKENDSVAKNLTADQIAGDYGYLYMMRSNGTFASPVRETKVTLTATGTSGGNITGTTTPMDGNVQNPPEAMTWTYVPSTGQFTLRQHGVNHDGYLLWQTLEGTNIKALAFTVAATEPAAVVSKYTYWGYKYPDATTAGKFLTNSYGLPTALGNGASMPAGETLWGTELTFETESDRLLAKAGGVTVREQALSATDGFASYSALKAGQRLVAVRTTAGLSVSFNYTGYESDWDEVLTGNDFRINLSVLEFCKNGKWGSIFESAAEGSGNPGSFWEIFKGSGTATISFNTDGSIVFYKNGEQKLRFAPATAFSFGEGVTETATVSELCAKVLAEFGAGTVRASYPMTNVALARGKGKQSVYDETPFLTLTDSSVTLRGTIAGAATGKVLPATEDAETAGFAVSFRLAEPFASERLTPEGLLGDWRAVTVASNGYNITLPNLDSWGVNEQHKVPDAVNKKNGNDWNCFLDKTCFVTVSVDKTNGVRYYLDGVLAIDYPYSDATVKTFTDGILAAIEADGCTVLTGTGTETVKGVDLIVTAALTEAQAKQVYDDYRSDAAMDAFRTAVAAVSAARTAETKRAAIQTALGAYETLTEAEQGKVAAEYAVLEKAIAAFNADAEAANDAADAAADAAVGVLTASVTALGAIAAVWFVIKRGL